MNGEVAVKEVAMVMAAAVVAPIDDCDGGGDISCISCHACLYMYIHFEYSTLSTQVTVQAEPPIR